MSRRMWAKERKARKVNLRCHQEERTFFYFEGNIVLLHVGLEDVLAVADGAAVVGVGRQVPGVHLRGVDGVAQDIVDVAASVVGVM